MAKPRKRKVVVDKKTAQRLHDEAKDRKIDEANEMPVPDDGLEHSAWPAEARKLAMLHVDPRWLGSTQDERAKECGYSLRSVQRYETDPKFHEYVNALARQAYGRLYPLWVAGMEAGLRRGDIKFLELYAKVTRMIEQAQASVNINVKTNGDDNVDAEIERLEKDVGVRKVVN